MKRFPPTRSAAGVISASLLLVRTPTAASAAVARIMAPASVSAQIERSRFFVESVDFISPPPRLNAPFAPIGSLLDVPTGGPERRLTSPYVPADPGGDLRARPPRMGRGRPGRDPAQHLCTRRGDAGSPGYGGRQGLRLRTRKSADGSGDAPGW